jgi:hypothetical protein
MIRRFGSPHAGVKHFSNCSVVPDEYTLSPSVKTAACTFATLSARKMLSTSIAVSTPSRCEQLAMSPTPTIADAPLNATCSAGAAAGGGVMCTLGLH